MSLSFLDGSSYSRMPSGNALQNNDNDNSYSVIKQVTCEPHAKALRHIFQVYICLLRTVLFDK